MNSKFLGDALDHWKGSLISLLLTKGLIRNVVAEPMITDHFQPWSTEDIETYKRLLNLGLTCTICHGGSTFSGKRADYFNEVPQDGDIFLDPDNGIATDKASRKHLRIAEIRKLLGQKNRVIMVYQHSGRGDFHQRLLTIKNKITDGKSSIHCTVYQCGQVAMFFISLSESRVAQIKIALREHLKGTAQRRVW
ncbi:MAG: hypothetical protein ACLQBD_27510 [Syntrophobacteraceae bacterium]